VARFLELHIEQGAVLDSMGIPIGIVENITGLFRWQITLIGKADHAGTTPMGMRCDALQGLAEFSGELPRILEENDGEDSVATIGHVRLHPGTANTVPGEVEFSLDVRDVDRTVLNQLSDSMRRALSAIARRRGLMFEFTELSSVEPTACDGDITTAISRAADSLGLAAHRMNSGAGHDAQVMAEIAPVGMIFVPSVGGRSHSVAEYTHMEDIIAGANVALRTLLQLASLPSDDN
jgi:N-carbamoyl-L-amino-acid hydrolase